MTSVSAKRFPCLLTTKIIFQYFDYIVHLETEFPCLLHRCLRTGPPPPLSSLYPQVSTFPGLNLFFSLNYLFMAYLYNLKYPILAKKITQKQIFWKKNTNPQDARSREEALLHVTFMSRLFTKIHLSRDWPLIYLKDDFQILQYLTENMFWFFWKDKNIFKGTHNFQIRS